MNRGIYATATGMAAAQARLDVIAHNLANANTTGFKKDGMGFGDTLVREIRASGGTGALLGTLGSGPSTQETFTVFATGPIQSTGNPLDVAIDEPKAAFAVETPSGVRYTRAGSFAVDVEGNLVNRDGFKVLDERLSPILLPKGTIEIADDGTVLSEGASVGKIGLFSGTYEKIGDTLFTSDDAQPESGVRLRTSAIEGSNVNAVEEMIQMIELNRAFEMAQRSIVQQDELTKTLISSLRE